MLKHIAITILSLFFFTLLFYMYLVVCSDSILLFNQSQVSELLGHKIHSSYTLFTLRTTVMSARIPESDACSRAHYCND